MPTLRTSLLAVALVALAALTAHAQTPCVLGTPCVVAPTGQLNFAWEPVILDPSGRDKPDGFRLKALRETATGVEVKSWDFGPATTGSIKATDFPDTLFHVTAVAYNALGESERSNVLGPFVRGTVPGAPSLTSATRVP